MTKDDKTKSYTLRLNSELYKKINERSEEMGIPMSSYIKMILHKEFRKQA